MTTASIAARINAERLVLLGWSRAILLQMAHPLVAAGVAEHSAFRASPATAARRLHETVGAMLGLTFGDSAEHARVVRTILAIHKRVNGVLAETTGTFAAGTRYSAEDPALVLWVHATLLDSTVLAYDAIRAPLDAADRDAYCLEAATVALELGARPDEIPRNWAALQQYLATEYASGRIAVGRDARLIADAVLRGRLTWLAGPVGWANRLITLNWLPADVRTQYGFTSTPRDVRHATQILAALRRLRANAPEMLALWSHARRGSQRPAVRSD